MTMKRFLYSLTVLILVTVAQAVGPKIPCMLTWTASPSQGVLGYWFYWRATNSIGYIDTQRWPVATNAAPFDLRVIGLPKGTYWITMSATNFESESDLAQEVMWNYTNPNKPTNLQISTP